MATVYKTDSDAVDEITSNVSGLAGFNLQDLAAEGRQRMDDYQRQADQLLADARIEAERIRQQAHQQGYEAGCQKPNKNLLSGSKRRRSSDPSPVWIWFKAPSTSFTISISNGCSRTPIR